MSDAIAAEWLKLRSVRSTYYVLGTALAFVGLAALLTWYAVATWDGMDAARRSHFALSPLTDTTSWVAALCLGVLGVIAMTTEFRNGCLRTSLVVVPNRRAFLLSKATVVGATALATGEAVTLGTFAVDHLIVGGRPIQGQPTSVGSEVPSLLVTGASVAVYALLGLGLAAIMRSAAGAIVTIALLWWVIPLFVWHLPAPWNERMGSFMLGGLPEQIAGGEHGQSIYGSLLPSPVAAAVLLAYAAIPLAAATIAITRRDA